jgi:hypothetical protein
MQDWFLNDFIWDTTIEEVFADSAAKINPEIKDVTSIT